MPAAAHIAGNPAHLTAQQRELVEIAGRLGRERFAPRAERHDRAGAHDGRADEREQQGGSAVGVSDPHHVVSRTATADAVTVMRMPSRIGPGAATSRDTSTRTSPSSVCTV